MKKNTRIDFLLSSADRAELEKAADNHGLTLSAWLRMIALSAARATNDDPWNEAEYGNSLSPMLSLPTGSETQPDPADLETKQRAI